ncbi:MAG: hypothetical protein L0227_19230, partial [Chloroflexi bacterium]|nr:hypothetical protein [Chloroflexota bacterium]
MAQLVLTGRAGSPGVGTGRFLPIAATASRNGASPTSVPVANAEERLLAALESAASQLEALATEVSGRVSEDVGS